MCRDLRVRCGSETRRIAYRPGGLFGGGAGRTGTPKAECMKTILNTDWLNRLTARIPPPWAEDLSPATASCDVGITQPAESLPRNSALWSALFPAPSELAVWRQIWRLHYKERARDANPLISANPLFSQRGETWRASPDVPCRHSWRHVFADTATKPGNQQKNGVAACAANGRQECRSLPSHPNLSRECGGFYNRCA